jgi:hypothetical protein
MHLRLTYMAVRRLLLLQREARTTADDCWHDATLTYPQSRLAINSWYSPELQAPANRTLFRIASHAEIYLNNGEPRDCKLHESVASYDVTDDYHLPEDDNHHSHRRGNLKSYI